MDGAIYLLSRKVEGDQGEIFMQNVTVFAANAEHARTIVSEQFTRLRSISNSRERAYQALPAFSIEKVSLEVHKLISVGVTG